MIRGPKTQAEARGWRYSGGDKYCQGYCAWSVRKRGLSPQLEFQCAHVRGYGPEWLWCRRHALMAKEATDE